jgi:3-hydroxyisobutyrate dehydrogenase
MTEPRATSPATTSPVATDLAATGPAAASPAATGPVATDLAATGPAAASPAATGPVGSNPAATNPVGTSRIVTNPATTSPAATDPAATDPADAVPAAGRPIGFIGLGNMGGRIARRLTEAGRAVLGYDPAPGAAEKAGATPAADVAEVTRGADLILLSLPDSRVIESVTYGPDGLLEHARPGQIVVDLSTAAPDSSRRIAEALAARGCAHLDAGVSGGAAAAEKGTLTLMVGGEEHVLDAVRPTLAAFSAKVFHMGPSGTGHSAKLLNNFLNAVSLAATSEVMVAGRKAGLDPRKLLAVLNSSSGANWATANRFPHIVEGDYLEGGLTSTLMIKDVVLYVDHLGALGVPSLNAAGPLASFGLAVNLGYADRISNRVVDAIGDVAGGIRLYDDPTGEEKTS